MPWTLAIRVGMRIGLLLCATGALFACNGSSSETPHVDAGEDAAVEGGVHDATAGETSATDSATEAASDACTPFVFDAGSYLPSTDDAGALIGAPCLPSSENSTTFSGFQNAEVILVGNVPSGQPTCVVNHFRGLVTCPYGQSVTGQAPACAAPCTTLDGQPVTGTVSPQCVDRKASEVVVWSCRCANAAGHVNDGDSYCTCPASTVCAQLISSIGAAEDDVSGAYCLSPGSVLDGGPTCAVACNPATAPCLD
jgi:hypothetical protein